MTGFVLQFFPVSLSQTFLQEHHFQIFCIDSPSAFVLCLPYGIIALYDSIAVINSIHHSGKRRMSMQIKVIYEDDALISIKESITQLNKDQLFFVEQHIRTLKQQRQDCIFQQWLCALQKIKNTYS